ncbi:LysR family transcriptional regulator [Acidicapsa dinghuensis]|uniref:LysR family transcriptional regulator n=1 Tax=Acidicapsa dinghuensis TaxID=2218256 RepID=A0ABW1EDA5_9BACT|nr:LysR family transcriptional regulator [Acidicapsa dinghuensis]
MYDWAEFRHFLYLQKVLEKGGFRIAAEELHTSQPNLTVQARRFQDHASVCLFRKLKNGQIRPTETGIAFITLARLVLEVREEVIDALVAIERGEIGIVRFGSTPLVDQDLFRNFCALHKELLPRIAVRPTHGDAVLLAKEILDGTVDAAMITLPFTHPDFHIVELRGDKIVVCLRRDHPLAAKPVLQVSDLRGNLTVIYHPQRHPDAHLRLLELLSDAGVTLDGYSCASHPSEMQTLVKEGHGLALMREGTSLEEGLTTRYLTGVNWTVDTAIIYHKQRYPKTIPVLVKRLKRILRKGNPKSNGLTVLRSEQGGVKHSLAEPRIQSPPNNLSR